MPQNWARKVDQMKVNMEGGMLTLKDYFGLEWMAVARHYNIHKTLSYFRRYHETMKLIDIEDRRTISRMHTIYLCLGLGAAHQLCMVIGGGPNKPYWAQLVLFDFFSIFGLSPLYSLHFSSVFLLAYFLFDQLYDNLNRIYGVAILSEVFIDGRSTFLCQKSIPSVQRKSLLVLNALQYLTVALSISQVIVYIDTVACFIRVASEEDLTIFGWIGFVLGLVSMHIFYVIFYACVMLFIHIGGLSAYMGCIIALTFFARLKQICDQHLRRPAGQHIVARLMRYLRAKHTSMRFFFTVLPHFSRVFTAYLLVNVPLNVTIVSMVSLGQLNSVQLSLLGWIASGQLMGMTVFHALAAFFSSSISSPYKRVMSLNIIALVRFRRKRSRHSLGELLKINQAIQAFHVKNRYGIQYGFGTITFGLVCMMALVKFFLLYGEFIMFQRMRLKFRDW